MNLGLASNPIHLAPLLLTSTPRVGHHWFPQSIITMFKNLKKGTIPRDVLKFFQETTTVPEEYIHRYDTWNDITHADYNRSMEAIARRLAEKGQLNTVEQAREFMKWIVTGQRETDVLGDLLKDKKLATCAREVRSWATGFFHAEYAAGLVKAANPNLTEAEVKEFSKAIARGTSVSVAKLSKEKQGKYAALLTRLKNMKKDGTLTKVAQTCAKTAFKVLGILALTVSVAEGATGNGHNPELEGFAGAADQLLYDSIQADCVEWIAKTVGDAVVPVAGVADSIRTKAGRQGVSLDLEPGLTRGHKDPRMIPKPEKSGEDAWLWPLSYFNGK